jgi:hypothetical protein
MRMASVQSLLAPAALAIALGTPCVRAQLTCPRPVFDFGQVAATSGSVSCTFDLRNAGSEALTVEDANASCGCIAAELQRQRLASGASLRLPVVLDVRQRSGMQRKSVHVRYRVGRGEMQVLTLSLAGTVVPAFQCEPATLDFGEVAPGSRPSRKVVVRSVTGTEFALRDVSGFPSQVMVRALTSGRAATHVVRVTLRALDPHQPLSGQVRMETDPAIGGALVVNVCATVVPDVAARPSEIYANAADALECRLGVSSPTKRRFRVTAVSSSHPRLRTELTGTPDAPVVLVTAAKPMAALDGQVVRIFTDLDDLPFIDVPLHVMRAAEPERTAGPP